MKEHVEVAIMGGGARQRGKMSYYLFLQQGARLEGGGTLESSVRGWKGKIGIATFRDINKGRQANLDIKRGNKGFL